MKLNRRTLLAAGATASIAGLIRKTEAHEHQKKEIEMSKVRDQLIGSWRMIDWKIQDGDTFIDPPFGPVEKCGGLLIYTAEGFMTATLSLKDRPPFQDGSVDGGTSEEMQKAYQTFLSYSGQFKVDEATAIVTHSVEYASFPNFVGKELARICIFEAEDILKLDTPPMDFGGRPRASYIKWQRT